MVRRERAYKVGYRRPPRRAQFRPGQSGNPRGRPKGSRNFASVMKKVLAKPINIGDVLEAAAAIRPRGKAGDSRS